MKKANKKTASKRRSYVESDDDAENDDVGEVTVEDIKRAYESGEEVCSTSLITAAYIF